MEFAKVFNPPDMHHEELKEGIDFVKVYATHRICCAVLLGYRPMLGRVNSGKQRGVVVRITRWKC